MADLNGGGEGILGDSNFKTLAFAKTSLEDFTNLIGAHVAGWTQRKLVHEGLKNFKVKVEAAESKMRVAKNVGKAKQLEAEEEALCKLYTVADMTEKISALNKEIQASLDQGAVTAEEKPIALEHLRSRRDTAKKEEKAKLLERVEKQIDAVAKAKNTITLPVANLDEFFQLRKRQWLIERLEKRKPNTLDQEERDILKGKAKLEVEVHSLEAKSRMWFESEFSFKPRLEQALTEKAKNEAEELKRIEEEEKEKQRRAEEAALEQKRLEAQRKEEEHYKQMADKLEAKRLEAQAKPVKEAPKAKPKEKKRVAPMNPYSLFQNAHVVQHEPEATPEASPETSEAGDPEPATSAPAAAPAATPAPAPAAAPVATPVKAPEPEPKPKPKPRAPKPVLENKWGAPAAVPDFLRPEEEDEGGPSLADALTAPKVAYKKPAAQPGQPGKKEAKTWARIDPHEIFQPPSREADHEDADDDIRALPATSVEDEPEPAPASASGPEDEEPAAPETEPAAPAATPEPEKPKPRPPKAVLECKWDSVAQAPQGEAGEDEEAGPSLADAAVAAKATAKKTPPPQPKKKEKKKFTKVGAGALGFDCDNKNH
uniref:Uncharacterized protein n=1 Tax=Alexandrium catenella TaxID=2925 RepID=A0A7S1W8M3_ALECA|mmetsp:Transcript_43530/g.117404  ORF Transcript_43530/g.117404 Transcript_43530/m.117404 type:complete len:598 (+) Transcript_43530:29-1822(+)